ncbi:MAG: cupin [Rhodospirillales bacterium 70-18]|nr:cupin domain-containing protein [Rhodospirillales bacterium]OJY65620.1 MAG: cupin [Rhodospirillales bacterium 70-18]
MTTRPVAVPAAEVPAQPPPGGFPPDLLQKLAGRTRRRLGEVFGLGNFGVNLTRLAPGAASSLRHAHARQDEFIYILAGTPTLVTDAGDTLLAPGMCAGFPAGGGDAHTLVNRGAEDVLYLEIGDRTRGDTVSYPDDDLTAAQGDDGVWRYARKDGTPL